MLCPELNHTAPLPIRFSFQALGQGLVPVLDGLSLILMLFLHAKIYLLPNRHYPLFLTLDRKRSLKDIEFLFPGASPLVEAIVNTQQMSNYKMSSEKSMETNKAREAARGYG